MVAALLVVGLVAGTICLMLFLSVRIGQESSAAALAARDAARQWTASLQGRQATAEKVQPPPALKQSCTASHLSYSLQSLPLLPRLSAILRLADIFMLSLRVYVIWV